MAYVDENPYADPKAWGEPNPNPRPRTSDLRAWLEARTNSTTPKEGNNS